MKAIRLLNRIDQNKLNDDFKLYDWDTLVYNEPNLDTTVKNLSSCIQEIHYYYYIINS